MDLDLPEQSESKWDINCDGYYLYCVNCNYEPIDGRPQAICPKCNCKMTNYDYYNNILNKALVK